MALMTTPTHAGLIAGVFVVRGEKFLMLLRGPSHGEVVWHLPGGQVEQRRRMLRRALADLIDAAALEAAGVDSKARAEELDVGAWGRLAST